MRTIIPKDARLVPENAKCVFKGKIFDVYHWQQKVFDETTDTFEMLKRPDTIKIIAIKDNRLVILDEEQPHDHHFTDFPGGRHDKESETELDAAKRELLEETGMSFKTWKLISVQQPHTKIEWFVYVFVATDFDMQIEPKLDNGEKIHVNLKSFDEVLALTEDPNNRWLPKEILERAESIEGLINFPEYQN